jgi:hypothetical protein
MTPQVPEQLHGYLNLRVVSTDLCCIEVVHGHSGRLDLGWIFGCLLGRLDAVVGTVLEKRYPHQARLVIRLCFGLGPRQPVVRSRSDVPLAGLPMASYLAYSRLHRGCSGCREVGSSERPFR